MLSIAAAIPAWRGCYCRLGRMARFDVGCTRLFNMSTTTLSTTKSILPRRERSSTASRATGGRSHGRPWFAGEEGDLHKAGTAGQSGLAPSESGISPSPFEAAGLHTIFQGRLTRTGGGDSFRFLHRGQVRSLPPVSRSSLTTALFCPSLYPSFLSPHIHPYFLISSPPTVATISPQSPATTNHST